MSVALFLLAGWIFQDDIFRSLGESLVHEDELRPAGAIVVLAGSSTGNRMRHAVGLWKRGLGKYLVFTGFERYPGHFSHDMMKEYALSLGVPEKNILTRKAVHEVSTWGEARDNLELMEQHGIKNFILVTTSWHTRRSYWIYKRRVEEAGSRMQFQVSPAKDPRFPVAEWWRSRQGKKEIVIEYVKTLGFFWEH